MTLHAMIGCIVLAALERHKTVAGAARELGVSRWQLRRLRNKYVGQRQAASIFTFPNAIGAIHNCLTANGQPENHRWRDLTVDGHLEHLDAHLGRAFRYINGVADGDFEDLVSVATRGLMALEREIGVRALARIMGPSDG